jgi:hypothetical protein
MEMHAAYLPPEKPTLRGMGGGDRGVFTVASPKNGTARRLTNPLPPLMSGEKSTLPKHGTSRPISPPKNPPNVEWGGGRQGVFTVASPKNSTESHLSPPKKIHHTCNGGGDKGYSTWRRSSTAVHVAYPPLHQSPIPPYPPPPHVLEKSKLKMRLTYLLVGGS